MTIAELIGRLDSVKQNGRGWAARCPNHNDATPSLSIGEGDDGRLLVKCFSGCSVEDIVGAMGLTTADLFPRRNRGRKRYKRGQARRAKKQAKKDAKSSSPGLTVARLAEAKGIPESFLGELGVRQQKYLGSPAVRVPYFGPNGEVVAVRFRISLEGDRFRWRSGDRITPYGLDRLEAIRPEGWILLVEGESDAWTGWLHKLPILGVPGKETWRSPWAQHLRELEVFVWQEPGAENFVGRIAADLPDLKIIPAPEGIKDLSEAHVQGKDVSALLQQLKAQAIPFESVRQEETAARLGELRAESGAVLAATDPLALVEQAIRNLGYGGDLGPPKITYLAATCRLLAQREGSMPPHLLLLGVPSAGKSYTVRVVLGLLPEGAYHVIEAGSPRVLIYDDADLRHRVLIFSEADSLPTGEDNPAASAIRNLLQDHYLHYKVVVKNPDTGQFEVQEITKPGPTTLITTSVKRLRAQLDSRIFTLPVQDDDHQVRAALVTQARLELNGIADPDPALRAFQAYLQLQAPWHVTVPFADRLAQAMGHSSVAPRILRDYARLLSLIKSVAVLRHQHRRRDKTGRLIAEPQDYRTIYDLVGEMYEATMTEADQRVRLIVEAVRALYEEKGRVGGVTATKVAERISVSVPSASARLRVALKHGWVVNLETVRGRPWKLEPGEPLPQTIGLPHPDSLVDRAEVPADDSVELDCFEDVDGMAYGPWGVAAYAGWPNQLGHSGHAGPSRPRRTGPRGEAWRAQTSSSEGPA